MSLTAQGNIRYRLKTPYRDGTTDVVFEPLDFMARLAALVPTPRVNLTRYHGVFAPNHRLREQVTPARRGRRKAQTPDEPAPARHVSMTWAQRLKRVFKIDILTCEHCGGAVKVIASIEDPAVIKRILTHLERRAEPATPAFRPFARAPPYQQLPRQKDPLRLRRRRNDWQPMKFSLLDEDIGVSLVGNSVPVFAEIGPGGHGGAQ